MKKNDLKKLCLLGLTCGASLAAQSSANSSEVVLAGGGCGGFSPRSYSQTSDNYIPSHSCGGQGSSGGYYAPAPQSSCGGQALPQGAYAPAPQGSCASARAPQGSCAGARPAPGYNQGEIRNSQGQGQGGWYSQDTATRNFDSQNQQWGQNAPNAGSSKNFPSTMNPAQNNMNPINNQNLQNPNQTK